VRTRVVGVPRLGVTSVGDEAKTIEPEPIVALPNAVTVPVVGSVNDVIPVVVNVVAKAPEVVKLPPIVIVFPVFATPVPPYWPAITEPFQVPVVIVPIEDRLERVATVVLTSVPDVGRVTDVLAVAVSVVVNAPEVVKFPPIVIVFPVFATPVPPYWPAITEPFQVPVAIVPTLVKEDEITVELSVVPESVPAGAITTFPAAAVNWP
jgi:hypothetical protein